MKFLKHENRTPAETSEDSKTCEPIQTSEIKPIKLVTGIVPMIEVIHSTFCEGRLVGTKNGQKTKSRLMHS